MHCRTFRALKSAAFCPEQAEEPVKLNSERGDDRREYELTETAACEAAAAMDNFCLPWHLCANDNASSGRHADG
jgi:hypothetical protein